MEHPELVNRSLAVRLGRVKTFLEGLGDREKRFAQEHWGIDPVAEERASTFVEGQCANRNYARC